MTDGIWVIERVLYEHSTTAWWSGVNVVIGDEIESSAICYSPSEADADRLITALTKQWKDWSAWIRIEALESESTIETIAASVRGEARLSTMMDRFVPTPDDAQVIYKKKLLTEEICR